MSNVTDIRDRMNKIPGDLPAGPRPPDNGGMEARVEKLEGFAQEARDRLARIETRMDTFATKEDMHKAFVDQTWKIVGAMLTFGTLLTAATYFIARNVH